jgi:hypothetical protein
MTLWAITSYFNPAACRHRYDNYLRFRQALAVPLLTVELFFGDRPDLNAADAEQLLQIRANSANLLWQKERLLNLACEALPADARHVCWLDCDLIFSDDDWPSKAESLLQHHDVVQLFSSVHHLPYGIMSVEHLNASALTRDGLYWQPSALYNHHSSSPIRYRKMSGVGLARTGNPGLAWAGSKELLLRHGLYERAVVGGGDRLFFAAACGSFVVPEMMLPHGSTPHQHWLQWATALHADLQSTTAFLDQPIFHLWHGDGSERRYRDRYQILHAHGYDPAVDVDIDANGCLAWCGSKARLEAEVADYVLSRGSGSHHDLAETVSSANTHRLSREI